jgi:phospholipid/cholesterol/gamma-HCH transport system substrate-binding protein/paraquat-inducible protein B
MASERKYFKIGAFVLGATGILTVAIVILGAGALFQKKYRIETYMEESIEGLDIGSPVKYRGVKVGELESTGFVATVYNNKDPRVRLLMVFRKEPGRSVVGGTMSERIQHLVDMGMRVQLASSGVMGDVYLELDMMDPKENPPPTLPWTPEYPFLPSVQSTGTKVTGQVVSILDQVGKIPFDQISQKTATLLDTLDSTVKKLDPALAELTTAATEAGGLLKDTRQLISEDGKQLKELLGSTTDLMKSGRAATDRLPATLEKIDGTLDRMSAALRRVDRTLAEEGGSLDQTIDNLRVATGDLRDLMGELKRYPKQAVFGEAPPKKAVTK